MLIASKSGAKTIEEFSDLNHLEKALATRAAHRLKELGQIMARSDASIEEKVNDIFALDVELATRLHIQCITFKMAHDAYKDHSFKDQRIKPLLNLLLKVFALKLLTNDNEGLYEIGFFNFNSKRLLTESMKHLLVQMRP